VCTVGLFTEPQVKRRGFRIRKKSSSQSESGSPPSPKLFNSLEQLSLSVESSDLPGTSQHHGSEGSHTGFHPHHHHHHHHGGTTGMMLPCNKPSSTSASGNSGTIPIPSQHSATPPKSPRRFSVLSPSPRRPSSSVPSSPKLGFSSISIPLWSPCKSLLGTSSSAVSQQPATSSSGGGSSSSSNPAGVESSSPSSKGTLVSRAGHGLGRLFGTSNSNTPVGSPSTKHRNIPSVVSMDSSSTVSTSGNISHNRQVGGVH